MTMKKNELKDMTFLELENKNLLESYRLPSHLENQIPSNNVSSQLHINVGTGKDMTIKELALLIAEIVEYKGKSNIT